MSTAEDVGAALAAATAAVEAFGDVVEQHTLAAARAAHEAEVTGLRDELEGALNERDGARIALTAARADLVAARARIAELEALLPDPEPPAPEPKRTIIGMSSPEELWPVRVREVGPGVGARRIFARPDLKGAADQMDLVRQADADGQLPVFSFKLDPAQLAQGNGTAVSLCRQVLTTLAAPGKPRRVTYWHEPRGDMTPAQFRAAWRRVLEVAAEVGGGLKLGPLLNGFLLDRLLPEFASWTDAGLLSAWDFVGIDTYQPGTMEKPGAIIPGDRVPVLVEWLAEQGHPDKPIVIGEYNGYTADAIARSGEVFLATPQVEVACMWNATGGVGYALTGDRLTAYQGTLADPRVR